MVQYNDKILFKQLVLKVYFIFLGWFQCIYLNVVVERNGVICMLRFNLECGGVIDGRIDIGSIE